MSEGLYHKERSSKVQVTGHGRTAHDISRNLNPKGAGQVTLLGSLVPPGACRLLLHEYDINKI